MLSRALLVIAIASTLPVTRERVHRVLFLGWLRGGKDFAYAEVLSQEGVAWGSVKVHSVSTARARKHCRLAEKFARVLLDPKSGYNLSDLGCETLDLVRKPLVLTQERIQAPDNEAVFVLERNGSRRFRIRLMPAGGELPWAVRNVNVGANSTEPVAYWAPGGNAVVFQFSWEGASTLEVIDYTYELACAYNALGLEAYQNEGYEDASIFFTKSSRRDPGFGDPLYNLACIHAIQGNRDRALTFLKKAVEVGGRRYLRLARRDPDFGSMRTWADFQELIRP